MNLVTIPEAVVLIRLYLVETYKNEKAITDSNINYLVQYGQIKKHSNNGRTMIDIDELKGYYDEYYDSRKERWVSTLGEDLNWTLSFEHLREKETTKHVHRLHPYKGKFIPQLVEYFIDTHTDDFKNEVFFKPGDVILDPFMGSGTTLVQANELGLHSIGIDISEFNCLISKCKIQEYDYASLVATSMDILKLVDAFGEKGSINAFEGELLRVMSDYNKRHFPSPDFKYQVKQGMVEEDEYGKEKEIDFMPTYEGLTSKYKITLKPTNGNGFLNKWYLDNIKKEILMVRNEIMKEANPVTRNILSLILSRTVRSCRATRHYDLATLKEPEYKPYYCSKHKKICKPIMTIKTKYKHYANDTIKRIHEFNNLRTDAHYAIINNDSRTVNVLDEAQKDNRDIASLLEKNRIKGIFTSPPYVGNIDYHEQHAYAYELFDLGRKDELEIGPLFKGQGKEARETYVEGISQVLINSKKFLVEDYNVFIVANDKYNLYENIAEKSGMNIVNKYNRPVLNRTERDRNPYSETIFHLKENAH